MNPQIASVIWFTTWFFCWTLRQLWTRGKGASNLETAMWVMGFALVDMTIYGFSIYVELCK